MSYSIKDHGRLNPKPEPSFGQKKPYKGKAKNRKRNKSKTCKICKELFSPTRELSPTCNKYECLVTYAANHLNKSIKEKAKQSNKEKKEFNLSDKTWLKNEAQKQFSKFIRLRDAAIPCISCDTTNNIQYHASHFKPAGGYSYLRFDENNVHKACVRCNSTLAGNLVPYRVALIEKVGIEEVERLEQPNQQKSWSIEELTQIIKTYRKKIKEFQN